MSTTAILKTTAKPRLSVKVQTLGNNRCYRRRRCRTADFSMHSEQFLVLALLLAKPFLPMHLPIILVGLLAGPYAGAIAGLLGPLASFALSGMPGIAMLPFMND